MLWRKFVAALLLLAANVTAINLTDVNNEYDNEMHQPMALESAGETLCCSGVNYDLTTNVDLKCCGSLLYDTNTEVCCNETVHTLNPNLECCGQEYFDPKQGICCPAYFLGTYKIVEFPPDVKDDEEAKSNMQCCGLKLVDTRNEICCQNRRNIRSLITALRGLEILSPAVRIRNHESLRYAFELNHIQFRYTRMFRYTPCYVIKEKKFKNSICCNGEVIDNDTANCSRKVFPPRFVDNSKLNNFDKNMGFKPIEAYCNTTKYDMKNQICCAGEFEGKMITNIYKKDSFMTACCGSKIYTLGKEICCNYSKIYPQNSEGSISCCGDEAYDETKEQCSNKKSSGYRHHLYLHHIIDHCHNESPNDVCCGNKSYDPADKNNLCCRSLNLLTNTIEQELIVVDDKNGFWACCGSKAYNAREQTCCGSEIYSGNHSENCCGNLIFNPSKEVCCNETIFEVNPREFFCCGFSLYDSKNQFCCNNRVYSFQENEYKRCCNSVELYDIRNQMCCDAVKDCVRDKLVKNEGTCCYTEPSQ